MRPRSIYIAGPMRGYPEHNHPAFRTAAARLTAAGWKTVSPVDIGEELCRNDPAVPGGMYLRADLVALAGVDAIAVLPGWACIPASIRRRRKSVRTSWPIPPAEKPTRQCLTCDRSVAGRAKKCSRCRSEAYTRARNILTGAAA